MSPCQYRSCAIEFQSIQDVITAVGNRSREQVDQLVANDGFDVTSAVRVTTGALCGTDIVARRHAAIALGMLGQDDETIVRLTDAIKDPIWVVREAAANAFDSMAAFCDESVEDLLLNVALQDRNAIVRCAATLWFVNRTTPIRKRAVDALIAALSTPRFVTRIRAIRALAMFHEEHDAVASALSDCLDDSHVKVRRVTLESLAPFAEHADTLMPKIIRRRYEIDQIIADAADRLLIEWLPELPAVWQAWIKRMGQRGANPEADLAWLCLQDCATVVQTEFNALCDRRRQWRLSTMGRLTDESPNSSSDAVESVLAAADLGHDRQAEAAWLISKFYELTTQA